MVAASINDAPIDDLELEDDVYIPERIRAFERAHARRAGSGSCGSWPGIVSAAHWPVTRW